MGEELIGQERMVTKKISTPLTKIFHGKQLVKDNGISIIISTRDDYDYFAKGISKGCDIIYRGYIDFLGHRGESVYSSPIRSIEFPEIKVAGEIKRIIIAKSVIASGCTAITLAKSAMSRFEAEELIIVAPFYCKKGVEELQAELRRAKMYVAFGPDEIDTDGMLIPGVGNIDQRLIG